MRPKLKLTRRQVFLGGLGLLIFIALLVIGGPDALHALVSASPLYVLLALLVTLGMTTVTARRWGDLTDLSAGQKLCSFKQYYRSFILSRAAGLVIPQTLGDFGIRPLLHHMGTQASGVSAFNGVLVERTLDGALLVATGIPSLLYLTGTVGSSGYLLTLALLVLLWLLAFVGLSGTAVRALARLFDWGSQELNKREIRSGRVTSWVSRMAGSLAAVPQSSSTLRRVGLLSIIRYGLIVIQFTLIANSLGLRDIGWLEIIVAQPAAVVGMLVAITPGSIGFLEGGFWGAFKAMGVPPASVNTFLVGQRVFNGIFIIVLAFSSLLPVYRNKGLRREDRETANLRE